MAAHSQDLGFNHNLVALASGIHIQLENAQGVTFYLYENGGAQSTAFIESIDGLSGQALTTVNDYFASDGVGGVWTYETDDADATLSNDSTFVKKDTTAFDVAAIYIDRADLSPGFNSVEATIDAGGPCIAVIHPLVQRSPINLPAAGV